MHVNNLTILHIIQFAFPKYAAYEYCRDYDTSSKVNLKEITFEILFIYANCSYRFMNF